MSREYVLADGAQLELRRAAGRDPALVLLHEGLGSVDLWKDIPEALARATGHAVIAYSRRGHGWSDPLPGSHAVSFMHHEARVVLPQLLSALGLEAPILVGHSDGGSIALIHAAMPGARVHAVVTLAPHVFVEPVSIQSIDADLARLSISSLFTGDMSCGSAMADSP